MESMNAWASTYPAAAPSRIADEFAMRSVNPSASRLLIGLVVRLRFSRGRVVFWDGLVTLYNPAELWELETTWQLVVESYNFVTGGTLDASDFAGD